MPAPDDLAEHLDAFGVGAGAQLEEVSGVVGDQGEGVFAQSVQPLEAGFAIGVVEDIGLAVDDLGATQIEQHQVALFDAGCHAVAGDRDQQCLAGADAVIAQPVGAKGHRPHHFDPTTSRSPLSAPGPALASAATRRMVEKSVPSREMGGGSDRSRRGPK